MKDTKALLLILLLAGCTSGYITPKAYEMAASWCAPHSGLRWAKVSGFDTAYWTLEVVCKDGVEMEQRLKGEP